MERNDLIRYNEKIYRVLSVEKDEILVIDCSNKAMPYRIPNAEYEVVSREMLPALKSLEELSPEKRAEALKKYSIIAPIVAVIEDDCQRQNMINLAVQNSGKSPQTIRSYLKAFLIYQDIAALASKDRAYERELSKDEKNFRWALNKFYYTQHKNSIPTAYQMMLKERYCNPDGTLKEQYPSLYQFKYYYRRTKNMEKYYISRNGIKHYQSNNRPLLGDGVQQFAPNIGTAMLDGTILDIYLINDAGELVGRPILIIACDANTSLCLGYSLLWEGGVYSLQQLLLNIIEDKQELCLKLGIKIDKEQWDVSKLPGIMVTDLGSEYKGVTFEQITELGITLVNLPGYRPELKGVVEKCFDIIQDLYKDVLKGKGVIMPDYARRGAHDYRKDATLTINDFEKILVRCIVYYNSERVIENYPFTREMLLIDIKPYASSIWNYLADAPGANLIEISKEELVLTLLPRTTGTFTRFGLKVNKLRYHRDGYKEAYLKGGKVTVSYNPDNCTYVWIQDDGSFVAFKLIETRFEDMPLDEVQRIQEQQRQIVKAESEENLKSKIELMQFVEAVAAKETATDIKIKDIRKSRAAARANRHRDIGGDNDD